MHTGIYRLIDVLLKVIHASSLLTALERGERWQRALRLLEDIEERTGGLGEA